MMRRWGVLLVVALAVLDVVVLGLGYRSRSGALPPWQDPPAASYSFDPNLTIGPAPSEGSAGGTGGGAPDTGVTGPVLMSLNADGRVVRASRGACEADRENPAQVAVADVAAGEKPVAATPEGLAEALGVMAFADGRMLVTGLDGDCRPIAFQSTDGGTSWESSSADPPGIWRLQPDTTASALVGPGGRDVVVGCPPVQVVNLPAGRGVVSCTASTFYELSTSRKPTSADAAGFTSLSVTSAGASGRFLAFGTTDTCGAQVAEVASSSSNVRQLACLAGDRAPLAIAASGDRIVVQVGNDLMVSNDEGRTFEMVGA